MPKLIPVAAGYSELRNTPLMGHAQLLGDQQHQLLQPIKAPIQGLEIVGAGFGGSFAACSPTLAALSLETAMAS